MVKKGKLLVALDAYKGRDYRLEKQMKQQKQAAKTKLTRAQRPNSDEKENVEARPNAMAPMPEVETDGWESDESEAAHDTTVCRAITILTIHLTLIGLQINSTKILEGESSSDSSLDGEDAGAAMAEEAEDQDDIPLSDVESLASEEKADILPHQRLTINNTTALTRALKSIALPSDLPFSVHQSITTSDPIAISSVDDDLSRELAFYKQSLDAVNEARIRLKKEGIPFSRPTDYFAEMVKSDEHMGKIKSKMMDEAASKKAAADARKQRDLKKFGKQVQMAKLQEKNKAKRETLDKINLLKRSLACLRRHIVRLR